MGDVVGFGVAGTGSFGAGLTRFLSGRGPTVVEVIRPDRSTRRRPGKSDPIDAAADPIRGSRHLLLFRKEEDGRLRMARDIFMILISNTATTGARARSADLIFRCCEMKLLGSHVQCCCRLRSRLRNLPSL